MVKNCVSPDGDTTLMRHPMQSRLERVPTVAMPPVLAIAAVVAEHERLLADVAHDHVDIPVVVEVAERSAAPGPIASNGSPAGCARIVPTAAQRSAVGGISSLARPRSYP